MKKKTGENTALHRPAAGTAAQIHTETVSTAATATNTGTIDKTGTSKTEGHRKTSKSAKHATKAYPECIKNRCHFSRSTDDNNIPAQKNHHDCSPGKP